MTTVEEYLRAKVKELESSKCEVEYELFRLKYNGGAEAGLVEEMQKKFNSTVEAASKKIVHQDNTISDLKDGLANEKKYSKTLKSTVENLKQAGSHTQSQMTSRNKTASNKLQTANGKIETLQKELDEKSRDVVKFRTNWKRAKDEIDILRAMGDTKEVLDYKRKCDDEQPMRKKQLVELHPGDSSDEDDEEPLVKQWMRKATVPTEVMAKIKLEKD